MTTPLEVKRDHCAFASRLLAVEIDATLYRRLLATSTLVDPGIAALTEQQALEALAAEFCRLFIGPRPACPPYPGSGRGQFLGSHAEQPFVDFLKAHHLTESVSEQAPVLARNHLAIQLQVFAHLCDAERTAPEAARRARHELETEHLNRSIPEFAEALTANAGLDPYRTVGESLRALFADETTTCR